MLAYYFEEAKAPIKLNANDFLSLLDATKQPLDLTDINLFRIDTSWKMSDLAKLISAEQAAMNAFPITTYPSAIKLAFQKTTLLVDYDLRVNTAWHMLIAQLQSLCNGGHFDENKLPYTQNVFFSFVNHLSETGHAAEARAIHELLSLLRAHILSIQQEFGYDSNSREIRGICALFSPIFLENLNLKGQIYVDPTDKFKTMGLKVECELLTVLIQQLIKQPILNLSFDDNPYQQFTLNSIDYLAIFKELQNRVQAPLSLNATSYSLHPENGNPSLTSSELEASSKRKKKKSSSKQY